MEPNTRVLDIGCATGRLAEKLREQKGCSVVGIECDKIAAQTARRRCNEVIVTDIEHFEDIPFQPGSFDIIVFADVLEHLREPETILNRFKPYLSEDGYILISVPNVAQWAQNNNLELVDKERVMALNLEGPDKTVSSQNRLAGVLSRVFGTATATATTLAQE